MDLDQEAFESASESGSVDDEIVVVDEDDAMMDSWVIDLDIDIDMEATTEINARQAANKVLSNSPTFPAVIDLDAPDEPLPGHD